MSTLTITRANPVYKQFNLHTWDVSAKPFVPRTNLTLSPPTAINDTIPSASSSPEHDKSTISESVAVLFKQAELGLSFGSLSGSSSAPLKRSGPLEDLKPKTKVKNPAPSPAAKATPTPVAPEVAVATSQPELTKPNKSPLRATTEYFIERWDKKDITPAALAILDGTYREARANPHLYSVPKLLGPDSPYPPVHLHKLPTLLSIWKTPYPNQSPTAAILDCYPEYAIQTFRNKFAVPRSK